MLLQSSTDDSGRFDASPPPEASLEATAEATARSDIFDYPYSQPSTDRYHDFLAILLSHARADAPMKAFVVLLIAYYIYILCLEVQNEPR